MTYTSLKAVGNVAVMAAILSALIPVDLEFLPAVRTDEIIDGLAFYKIQMAVPPFVPAGIAAETLPLPLFCLLYPSPAVLALCDSIGRRAGLFRFLHIRCMPPAVGFHGIHGNSERLRDRTVARTLRAELHDLFLLFVSHGLSFLSGSSSPYLLPEKSTPIVTARRAKRKTCKFLLAGPLSPSIDEEAGLR